MPGGMAPAVTQAARAQPAVAQPASLQPARVQPATVQPAILQPAILQPAVAEPDVGEPARGQPGADLAGPTSAGQIAAISVDIGCVRMTERHLHSDPPAGTEIAAAVTDIDAAISRAAAEVPVQRARTLVGLAGSVTTVAGIALGLPAYDASRIHHARIPAGEVHAVTQMLLGQTRVQRGLIGVMHPGRIDVIGAGALVLDRILVRLGFAEVVVSEHDILDGIAWALVDHHGG